jgi:CRISPR system Cascade subunit CasD
MNTLLFRLSGAMQSWGVQSRFSVRDTGLEPSKSGVLGLVCAAMGIGRADDVALARLAALHMGVRVDREGRLKVDYHTAKDVLKAGGGTKDTEPSHRYYLSDAAFLVGLTGEDTRQLQAIHAALRNPVWPLYLGRKAFVPGEPVWLEDGFKVGMDLLPALETYPYLGRTPVPERLRLVYDDREGVLVRPDQPLSFNTRRFAPRRTTATFIPTPNLVSEVP